MELFTEMAKLFSEVVAPLYIPMATYEHSSRSVSLPKINVLSFNFFPFSFVTEFSFSNPNNWVISNANQTSPEKIDFAASCT